MLEGHRSPSSRVHSRRRVAPLLTVLLGLVAIAAAGCTEKIEGGSACPSLCPTQGSQFRDTILDASVVLDTVLSGYPEFGLSGGLLLANRGDTIQTSAVIRYDILPTSFRPNRGTDTASITAIDSVWIRLALDTAASRGTSPVTIEAFDVDTSASDSVTAVVRSLFRPDRLLGSVTFTPTTQGDSVRIRLDKSKVLAKIQNKSRLRIGLHMTGTGQISFLAFALSTPAPLLSFDPTTDTLFAPTQVLPATTLLTSSTEQSLAYTVYSIGDRPTASAGPGVLQIGGYPGRRSYLVFNVPSFLLDSTTIVRAQLLLTQIASPAATSRDTALVEFLIPVTTSAVTDIRRILDLAASGADVSVTPLKLSPTLDGLQSVNVLGIVRNWRFLKPEVPRAIGLRLSNEGASAFDVRFHSLESAVTAARPRLRITYLPRTEFGLP